MKSPRTTVAQLPPIPAVGIKLLPEKTQRIQFRETSPVRLSLKRTLENREMFLSLAVHTPKDTSAAVGRVSASFQPANVGRETYRHQDLTGKSAF